MAYKALWHEKALDDLKALDRQTAQKIIARIKEHLARSPENFGKSLKGVLEGLYRYRLGDFRIIYSFDKAENLISILHIGLRKDVYR